MVIRGNIRGNGPQLAHYLLNEGGNERIRILDVDGRSNASPAYLQQALHTMSLTAELTRTDKGLYHAQISPAYGEDRRMSAEDWHRAADILGHELGLSEQRRVIVLHTKKDRTHAHIVFERYDHETGTVIKNKFSRLAQDRARKEMERVFNHERTPHRNQHRPELKDKLTQLWQDTDNADDFVQAVNDNGYMLAEGVPRHPFMVVDENGRSFDLVRQLKGVRIKEVRQRLRDVDLIPEKQAIEEMRQRHDSKSDAGNAPQVQRDDENKAIKRTMEFFANRDDTVEPATIDEKRQKQLQIAELFLQAAPEMTETKREADLPEKKKDAEPVETSSTEINKTHREQNNTEPSEDYEDPREAARTQSNQERSHVRLTAFMASHEEVTTEPQPLPDQQRQLSIARQFFDNDDLFAAQPAETQTTITDQENRAPERTKDAEVQKLMQEQKEARERKRGRTRKPSR